MAWITGIPLGLAVAAYFLPVLFFPTWMAIAALILFSVVDFWLLPRAKVLDVRREIPGTMPVGVRRNVKIRIAHRGSRATTFRIWDYFPGGFHTEGLPSDRLTLRPHQALTFSYPFVPGQRGSFEFGRMQLEMEGPLGLWQRLSRVGPRSPFRVYPDYAAVLKSAMLAAQQRLDMMGILKRRRRGEGTDFHQLREFRVGDRMNQINWKATAKLRQIISNEFQEERDQQIIFLVDCSYRMRSHDGELSHFDHTLNAVILLSYFAVKQGDAIGMMTFGDAKSRYVPPKKSAGVVPQLLEQLFDLQPSHDSPDYAALTQSVLTWVKKRSLIILVTTLRDDVSEELNLLMRLLSARHAVLLVNIRESILGQVRQRPIHRLDDALTWCGGEDLGRGTRRTVNSMRSGAVEVMDCPAHELPVAIANRYFMLKKAGRI